MRLSLILIEKDLTKFTDYINECKKALDDYTNEMEIIVVTPNKLPSRISKQARFIYCANNEYQQLVMAGIDNAKYENVLIANSSYKVEVLIQMVCERLKGVEIVCVKPKVSKLKRFFISIAQGFYNLILRTFNKDLFTIGILKDIQLISGEALELLKDNQSYAHRIRTMYAPLEYSTKNMELHLKEIDNTKNKWLVPKLDSAFYISSIITVLLAICLVGGVIACAILKAGFVAYFLVVFLTLLFGFVSCSVAINCIAKTKIGILHNQDKFGKIYTIINK